MLVNRSFISFVFLVFFLSSCATTNVSRVNTYSNAHSGSRPIMTTSSVDANQKFLNNSYIRNVAHKDPSLLKPVYKDLSPLDTKVLSLSFKHEDFRNILFLIANQLGLNLVISKNVFDVVPPEKAYLTLEFHDMTVRSILDAITDSLGLSYRIRNGILFVDAYQEKLFDLGFLTTLRGVKFDLGGDVLGGNVANSVGSTTSSSSSGNTSEIVNPLKGNFELSGENRSQVTDIYRALEQNIKSLLSKNGVYTLNPYTGTLFVKDYVSNVKQISRFINTLKRRYKKQVLIEAKIIEVELSKQHQMGINWQALVKNDLKDTLNLSAQSSFFWNNEQSFVFQFTGAPYFDAIIKALENYGHVKILSNPRLRVVHAQPAMISVGRSIAYIKEIERQITSSDNLTTVETNVQTSAVFDGLLFGVTPYIDADNTVTLHLVPITSNVLELQEKDFGDNYAVTLPQISLRETSTVIRVHNNALVVIGGLILNKENSHTYAVPILGHLPGVGRLFRQDTKDYQKVELVILLKVRLVS